MCHRCDWSELVPFDYSVNVMSHSRCGPHGDPVLAMSRRPEADSKGRPCIELRHAIHSKHPLRKYIEHEH